MTDSDWLTSADPQQMLASLRDRGRLTERKARLFAVACCRRIWHLLTDERSRRAVEAAARYAGGNTTEGDLDSPFDEAQVEADEALRRSRQAATPLFAAAFAADPNAAAAAIDASHDAAMSLGEDSPAEAKERQAQCHLLRCT